MDSNTKNSSIREAIKTVSTIISWTIFTLLVICVIFLSYCFISTQIYATKGEKYEPKISLYTIVSPSMTPNINVYDVIVNLKVDKPEDIKINDVITFISTNPETEGMTITHRVISIIKDKEGKYNYQTKGDYALVEDAGTVSFSNIIGRVAFRIPKLGRIQFFLAEKMHWLLIILIPALYIIVRGILQRLTKGKEFKQYHLFKIGTKNKLLFLPFKSHNINNAPLKNNVEPEETEQKSEFDLDLNIIDDKKETVSSEPVVEEKDEFVDSEPKEETVQDIVVEINDGEEQVIEEEPIVEGTEKLQDNSEQQEVEESKIIENEDTFEIDLPDLK